MNPLAKPFNPTGRTIGHLQRLFTRPPTRHFSRSLTPQNQDPTHQTVRSVYTSRVKGFGRPSSYRSAQSRWSSLPRRKYSTNTKPDVIPPADATLSVSQRFRKLSREYGWAAMGVYLGLSALDFPFCFAAVRWLGPDRVGRAEKAVVEKVKDVIPQSVKDGWHQAKAKIKDLRQGSTSNNAAGDASTFPVAEIIDDYDHGVVDAELRVQGANASIWTQLALAYAIHKSFIFIRLPITVAILPKVVKTLRGWGWQIGKRKVKNIQVS